MARDFGFRPAEGPDYYFVSYNSEDADRVASVVRCLADSGIPLWYDRGLVYGEKWEEQITAKIAGAKAVLLFFTRGILQKEDSYVKKEYRIATRMFDRMVYVIMLDEIRDAEVPVSMAAWWTDILDRHNIGVSDSPEGTASLILGALEGADETPRTTPAADRQLPHEISLFELLGIRNINEFDIGKQWAAADPTVAIAAPIGLRSDGTRACLDLHQRTDGPNGIVGGATGMGKTEFLNTFLLSLALHYPPEHVRIHVVDPFQHGTFDAGRSLPHMGVGLNHCSDEAFAAFLNWFDDEKARRDALLAQYDVQNIYQYLKKVKACPEMPPMPHMVVAIDSCEQLKLMSPQEFRDLLRLGSFQSSRRYGIHLILTTDRAAGVMDVELNMCTNFRIYSVENQGASIPGRMYLQTPVRDMPEQIQVAYGGKCTLSPDQKNNWKMVGFFNNKSQQQSVVEAIGRFCLD